MPAALAQNEPKEYENQTRKLSMNEEPWGGSVSAEVAEDLRPQPARGGEIAGNVSNTLVRARGGRSRSVNSFHGHARADGDRPRAVGLLKGRQASNTSSWMWRTMPIARVSVSKGGI